VRSSTSKRGISPPGWSARPVPTIRRALRQAFELTVCRLPRPEEERAALAFLARQQAQVEADAPARAGDARRKALQAFCLVLLNTNEFVYPD